MSDVRTASHSPKKAAFRPALAKLRQSTQQEHAALEQVLDLSRAPVTLSHLKAFMAAVAWVYVRCAPAVLAHADRLHALGLSQAAELRHQALVADLDVLGLPWPKPPRSGSVYVPTLAHALGLMYVFEGSRLGGQIMVPHLKKTLGLSPERGLSYLMGYGDATKTMWRHFLVTLEKGLGDARARQHAADAAKEVFVLYRCALVAQHAKL